jgi:hypothetical protein
MKLALSLALIASCSSTATAFVSPSPQAARPSTRLEAQPNLQTWVATAVIGLSVWGVTLPATDLPFVQPSAAVAKEMASGTGSRVNKDPESLLRLGLPINNKEVRCSANACVFVHTRDLL